MAIEKEIEVVEPEIVSITPVADQTPALANKSAIATKQQEAQLQGTQRDLEVYLPKLDKAIETILDAVATIDLEALSKIKDPKKLKDLTGALASLKEMRNTIIKPQQVQTSTRKKRRYQFKDDKGHTVEAEEEVTVNSETPEAQAVQVSN
jgi:predicted  nucleic acid-binding Zn-ribbon protein